MQSEPESDRSHVKVRTERWMSQEASEQGRVQGLLHGT